MVVTPRALEQSTVAYYGALLSGLNSKLEAYGIVSRVVRVIRLRLLFNDYSAPDYLPPVLEVRGADRRLRASVTVVRGAKEPAYSVRPTDGERYYLFPVSEGAAAVAFVVGRARDWQLTR
ncbi:hypothetical protein GCM10009677_27610 [Sphaerisporangium rubeum]|uniref:Uncharacterized protein n=1 Tax=Sphaerisporangium rubeum TaxID=321317 RepID=A0A7X0IAV0_9ACTN|nr:hypothetical protein [Sphaerisporangium rubeum]MBB6471670.1 hypothetical protein [Sphaerisporangium rubeum]